MKSLLLFALLLLVAGSTALSQEQPSPVGTWKMVFMKWSKGDSTGTFEGTMVNHIKIITPTHYATLTQNMDGSFRRAEGGTVTFEGNTFSETPTHGINTAILGKPSTHRYEMKGDKMHSVVNSKTGYYFDEIWQRVQQ